MVRQEVVVRNSGTIPIIGRGLPTTVLFSRIGWTDPTKKNDNNYRMKWIRPVESPTMPLHLTPHLRTLFPKSEFHSEISSLIDDCPLNEISTRETQQRQRDKKTFECPAALTHYQQHMGGVDKGDQLRSHFGGLRKENRTKIRKKNNNNDY